MAVLIIFPVILQTVINLIMLSIGGQGGNCCKKTQVKLSTTQFIVLCKVLSSVPLQHYDYPMTVFCRSGLKDLA